MSNGLQDLRYAVRLLTKSPGFTMVAIITLALGVGANTAVFSLINSVLLRPLPYDQPDRLVLVWESAPFFGLQDSPVAPANYFDWKTRSRSFEEMGALEDESFRLTGEGAPEIVEGSVVTASFLRTLGTRPVMGRIFTDQEDRPGAAKVALISHGFWMRKFSADPNIIGKAIRLGEEPHTIVGVLAPGTEPPAEYRGTVGDIWTPLGSAYTDKRLAERGRHNWMVVARLKSGVTRAEANVEVKGIGEALAREYPDTNEKVGAFVAPLREHFVGSSRRVLLILLGTVTFVLLIACCNVANLLLSRAANRTKEVAVRSALGAGYLQLARQFLCESLLLCVAGAGGGVLLASSTFEFLAHLAPATMTGLNVITVDWRVLGFTTAIAGLTTIAFGLVPLFQMRRVNISESLKSSSRTLAGASHSRGLRALLICSEVALAFMLLIGSGLLIRTFANLRGVDVGFRTDNLLTLRMPAMQARRDAARMAAFQRQVLQNVRALPGVVSAGFTNHIPLVVKGDISGIGAEGRGEKEKFQCNTRAAGPGYFQTMGIPILRGRDIQESDIDGAPFVALINQTLANTLWPGQDPLGRRLVFRDRLHVPVVGIVADLRQSGLDIPPKPEFYVSSYQAGWAATSLAIHTSVAPSSISRAVQQAIWSIDPDQPITDLATMQEILDREVFQKRTQTIAVAVFSGIALLLAAIGLYGVLAYLVAREIPEIGIRMALGASPSGVLRRVIGNGMKLAAAGLVVGLAGALALTRFLSSLLFGVKPADPVTYVAVAVVLLVTAAVASYVPARRAMRVDPITALRDE